MIEPKDIYINSFSVDIHCECGDFFELTFTNNLFNMAKDSVDKIFCSSCNKKYYLSYSLMIIPSDFLNKDRKNICKN